MLHFSPVKKAMILLTVLFGFFLALPNFLADSTRESLPSWAPSEKIRLGLDLQGGAHVLVSAQMGDVYQKRMDTLANDVRRVLREAGNIKRGTPVVKQDSVTVRIRDAADLERARIALNELPQPLQSGAITGINSTDLDITLDENRQAFRLQMNDAAKAELRDRTIIQALEVVRRRIDPEGIKEPTVARQGTDRILIQVPGAGSAREILDVIEEAAVLNFHVVTPSGQGDLVKGIKKPTQAIYPDAQEGGPLWLVDKVPLVRGEQVVDANPSFDQNGEPVVSFRFNAAAGQAFGRWTQQNVGQLFAIVVDDKVISAPVIREPILGGSGQISGNFTVESSSELAIQIASGALPAKLIEEESRTVGPELGADSIHAGTIACIVGFIGVMIFMVVVYGRFGVIADVALLANMVLIFGALSGLGATLTLPGIAGIVLTIGMAVDANVLIFERIREELESGKKPLKAIEIGYEKAFSAIIDANVTTLLAAAVLYAMGSGPVKGFAVTLGIGIVTSVFTAVFLTRLLLSLWYDWKRPKTMKITLWEMVKSGTKVNFLRGKKIAAIFSIIAVLASGVLFATKGLNFGIDFRGGSIVMVETPDYVDPGEYRAALSDLDLGDIQVQEISDPGKVLEGDTTSTVVVRINQQDDDPKIHREAINAVETAIAGTEATAATPAVEGKITGAKIMASDTVGAKVSGELVTAGIMAVVLAIGGVLVYIWLRFEWQFSVGAVVALTHDVALTIGVFSLLSLEFNLSIIAAILTIVGYSLNDTVVVYDRVREKLRKYKKMPLDDLINFALNKTLSRTMMTSLTTLLALIALYVLGGPVMQGFTFAMIWGVVVGTYSSVFVAAPILEYLGVKRDWSKVTGEGPAGVTFGEPDAP
jgi:preprotein translocase subunit SecD